MMEVSQNLEELGPGFSNKVPLLPCCVPNLPPSTQGSSPAHPPSQAPALSVPLSAPPPQGFQDLGPEFRSIFAQTKQEDGFNTSPCCRLSDALVSCSSKAGGHLWPPPSASPASTDLAMQNEWSQGI